MSDPSTEPDARPDPLPEYWHGRLAPLDTADGQGRILVSPPGGEGVRTIGPLPGPLYLQVPDSGDGVTMRQAGHVADLSVDEEGFLFGSGTLLLEREEGRTIAQRLAEREQLGVAVSIHPYEVVPEQGQVTVYQRWALAGVAVTEDGAFPDCGIRALEPA